MAAPKFAPTPPIDDARGYESPPVVPDGWLPDRPAEIIGFQPEGPRLGFQGPDQGYAIKLAKTFSTQVHLLAGERFDDVVGGVLGIALRRASEFSRAPVIHDLTIAFTMWGFLDPAPPGDLVASAPAVRRPGQPGPPLRGRPGARRRGAGDDAADDAGAGDRGLSATVARTDRGTVMQDINLSDEQREFRAVMRRFAENEIAPHAAEIDRTGEYGWASWEALKSMELTALSYPEAYGGSGASLVDQAIAAEELARVCASTSLAFLVNKLAMLPVINFGSEWMKSTYLPKICAARRRARYG